MAYISNNEAWENEFHNIVFQKNKEQDLIINQLKLLVHDTYKKDERITTTFEPISNEDVVNKAYLDEKFKKKKRSFVIITKRIQRT